MGSVEAFARLLAAGHSCISIRTTEETHAVQMVKTSLIGLVDELWQWDAVNGLVRGEMSASTPIESTLNAAAALKYVTDRPGYNALVALDLMDHLSDPRVVRAVRDLVGRFDGPLPPRPAGSEGMTAPAIGSGHLVLVDHGGDLPSVIASSSTTFEVPLPDEQELETILRRTLTKYNAAVSKLDIEIKRSDLDLLIRNLQGLTRRQAERVVLETIIDDRRFDAGDMSVILEAKRRMFAGSGALEFVDKPTDLSQIGGMRNLKRWLEQRARAFGPDAVSFGLKPPRGVLMLGVQGTGKSLCAKAIATAWDRPLLRLDAGALYNQYIGESERRLREALKQAEAMAPVVLWIDEVEKAFSSASSSSNDGGLSRRMFGSLLTWMQEHQSAVFLVATANDIDALPPELLRKGRFDDIFFVDLPREDVRADILAIHLRKRGREPQEFDLARLARETEGYSAAELEQGIVAAMHAAYSSAHGGGQGAIDTDMVSAALLNSPPLSVTASEKIAALQAWAEGRCVPAD